MSPLNSSNVDSQGIIYQLNSSSNEAIISGHTEGLSEGSVNVVVKRGVSDTNGKIYKVVGMTSDCLTDALGVSSLTFDKTELGEFVYDLNGFPTNLEEVVFKGGEVLHL